MRVKPACDAQSGASPFAGKLDKRQEGSENKQISESTILIAQAYVPVVAMARVPVAFAIQVVA
jgi:hypothetical protein